MKYVLTLLSFVLCATVQLLYALLHTVSLKIWSVIYNRLFPSESSKKSNYIFTQMEKRYTIFERFVIDIKRYKDIFSILNKDEDCDSKNVLQKLENLEYQEQLIIVDWRTVDFALIIEQGTIFRGTLLHAAVASGYKKIVKALIDYGANIEAKCFKGFTPLHYAVINDKAEIMELLIDRNANVNAVDLKGCTPLHLAAAKGSPRLANLLLSAGAEVNATDRFYNVPLHFAVNCIAAGKSAETVRTLMNFGADVNAKDEFGNTVLHRTIMKKDNKAVLKGLLVTYKEEIPNRDTFTKIVMLNKSKNTENVVELLLTHGALPEVRNIYGDTVLHCSIMFSSVRVIKLLARYGADVNSRDHMWRAPLYCLGLRYPFSREEISHIVYTFIKKGADIDSTYANGPPTLQAIMRSNRVLAKLVIRWAVVDNHERVKPSYLRDYPGLSALWDSFSRKVKRELQRLSVEVKHKAIFDLLRSTNLNKLATLVNNENVFSKLHFCEINYPVHVDQIVRQYEKGWKRFQLLNMSEESITKLYQIATNSSRFLPKEIAREIAYYLTNKEIRNLITAVQCSGHSKRKKLKLE